MAGAFWRTMFSDAAKRMQTEHGSRAAYARRTEGQDDDLLGDFEREFIHARDSFYLASVTPDGWPYVQHRGGAHGFLKVLDSRTLAFADFSGNKQYITAGNLATNDRVALFLMDYPNQARLKIVGHARIVEPAADPTLHTALRDTIAGGQVERLLLITVVGFDWNCSQHIVERLTREEWQAERLGAV